MYQRLFAWNAGNLGISGPFLRSWLPYKYRPLLSKVLAWPLKVAGNPEGLACHQVPSSYPFDKGFAPRPDPVGRGALHR